MPNYYLSVLYKHIIQVENKNVGLKVGGHKHTIAPPVKKVGGHMPPLPPRFLRQCMGRRCGYQTENPHHLLLGFPLFSRVLLDLGLGLGLGLGSGLGLGLGLGSG